MSHSESVVGQVKVIRRGVGEFCDLQLTPVERLGGILDITNEAPSVPIGSPSARLLGQAIFRELGDDPNLNFDQPAITVGALASIAMSYAAQDPYPMGEYVDSFSRFGSTPRQIAKRTVETIIYDPKVSFDDRDLVFGLARDVDLLFLSNRLIHGVTRKLHSSKR